MKPDLFSARPQGFEYYAEFLGTQEERDLLKEVEGLPFNDVRMHGVVAKRRVFHFGLVYGYDSWKLTPGPPLPEFLLPLRDRIAPLLACQPDDVAEILVTKYPPGAGIGWHRDAPMFGPAVVGISLLGPCRFRFQRRTGSLRETFEELLEPRSAYVLSGEARSGWQHSIPATKGLRYSITLRTLKSKTAAAGSQARGSPTALGS
jgi:alkylated DNA repair dioxygenase AlkB